jgi:hypothetical protein
MAGCAHSASDERRFAQGSDSSFAEFTETFGGRLTSQA